MSQRERELMAAFGQVAGGQDYDTVIGASANMILNGLRQKHPKLKDADHQLERLIVELRGRLAKDHYDSMGRRKEQRLIIPPLRELASG